MNEFLNGYKVIENPYLTTTKRKFKRNPRQVYKNRLTKRVKTDPSRFVVIPSTEIIIDEGSRSIIMHPATKRAMNHLITKRGDDEGCEFRKGYRMFSY